MATEKMIEERKRKYLPSIAELCAISFLSLSSMAVYMFEPNLFVPLSKYVAYAISYFAIDTSLRLSRGKGISERACETLKKYLKKSFREKEV